MPVRYIDPHRSSGGPPPIPNYASIIDGVFESSTPFDPNQSQNIKDALKASHSALACLTDGHPHFTNANITLLAEAFRSGVIDTYAVPARLRVPFLAHFLGGDDNGNLLNQLTQYTMARMMQDVRRDSDQQQQQQQQQGSVPVNGAAANNANAGWTVSESTVSHRMQAVLNRISNPGMTVDELVESVNAEANHHRGTLCTLLLAVIRLNVARNIGRFVAEKST